MVEARGIEPLSKSKIHTASTRLVKVKISSKKAHFPKPKFRLRLKISASKQSLCWPTLAKLLAYILARMRQSEAQLNLRSFSVSRSEINVVCV